MDADAKRSACDIGDSDIVVPDGTTAMDASDAQNNESVVSGREESASSTPIGDEAPQPLPDIVEETASALGASEASESSANLSPEDNAEDDDDSGGDDDDDDSDGEKNDDDGDDNAGNDDAGNDDDGPGDGDDSAGECSDRDDDTDDKADEDGKSAAEKPADQNSDSDDIKEHEPAESKGVHKSSGTEDTKSIARKISSDSNQTASSTNSVTLTSMKPGYAKQPSPHRSALDGLGSSLIHDGPLSDDSASKHTFVEPSSELSTEDHHNEPAAAKPISSKTNVSKVKSAKTGKDITKQSLQGAENIDKERVPQQVNKDEINLNVTPKTNQHTLQENGECDGDEPISDDDGTDITAHDSSTNTDKDSVKNSESSPGGFALPKPIEAPSLPPTFYIEDLSEKVDDPSVSNEALPETPQSDTGQVGNDPSLLGISEDHVALTNTSHSAPTKADTIDEEVEPSFTRQNKTKADASQKQDTSKVAPANEGQVTNDLSKETAPTSEATIAQQNIRQSETKIQYKKPNVKGSSKRGERPKQHTASSSSKNHPSPKTSNHDKKESTKITNTKESSSLVPRPGSSTARQSHTRSSKDPKGRIARDVTPTQAKMSADSTLQPDSHREASSSLDQPKEINKRSSGSAKSTNSSKDGSHKTEKSSGVRASGSPANNTPETSRSVGTPRTPNNARKRSGSSSQQDTEINSGKHVSTENKPSAVKQETPRPTQSGRAQDTKPNTTKEGGTQSVVSDQTATETTQDSSKSSGNTRVGQSIPQEKRNPLKSGESSNSKTTSSVDNKSEKPVSKVSTDNATITKGSTPRPVVNKTKGAALETNGPSKERSPRGGTISKLLALSLKSDWSNVDYILRGPDKITADTFRGDPDQGVTPLMIACRESRLVIAEKMIELGASVNERAKDGRTALHFAAAQAKDDLIKLLTARKADCTLLGGPKDQLALHMACARPSGVLNMIQILLRTPTKDTRCTADKDGMVPLFMAVEAGNTAVCRELLSLQNEQQVKLHRKDTGDTPLHMACRRKDFDMAKLCVDNGASVDAKNRDGHTPLHVSAWEGDETLVKYLYMNRANPNIVDKMDRSPLHIAAERGHTAVVELLVDKVRANVSARTKDGSTLMHIASQFGHPDTALAFLKKGVPLLMPNKSGALCLHSAAMKGHVNVLKALLLKGALPDSKTKDHYTALHVAVEACKPLTVQTLLGYGAQVELKGGKAKETPLHIAARVKDGEKCAEMLIKSGADVNATRENGETALHIASRNGYLKMVKALVEEGADPSWQSKSGETPLHIAVRYCHWEVSDELLTFVTKQKSRIDAVMLVNHQNTEGETSVHYAAELTKKHTHNDFEDTDIIKLLLSYDGDINISTKLTQETPLHYCARSGNSDVMMEVMKHIGPGKTQFAVNRQAKNGWSPLLVASEEGHLSIVKILLSHNARVDVFDEHGKAALHLAAESGHGDVGDVLLLHRAFVNAKSKLGVTPLHLASQNGYSSFVKLLIETHGATIDALSLAKKTPLHLAAQHGKLDVCNILLKMKADANATDVHGQTPLHLAAENDHSDVVKLFLKHRPELVTMGSTNGMTCAHIAASKGSVSVVKELMRFNKAVVTTARNKTSDSTTLHLAAVGGHGEVIKVLIDAGASATDENSDGMTAIHLAARYGHINVLEALQEKVSWKVTSSKTGFTALHVAAHYGQMDFVREMLAKVPATVRSEMPHTSDSALRDIGSEYGLTPLHLASQSGHEGIVRMLLNSPGVQADAATSVHGTIPLHQAAQNGHTAVVSLLLSKSTIQMHTKDKRGRTALHLGAANGHLDMVSLLLGQGADIDVFDKNGWTAMHFAAKAGHLPVVKLLMEAGANPKYETKDGKVPICYAATASHAQVLSYLVKRDHDTHHLMEDKKFIFDLMIVGKMHQNEPIQEFVLTSPAPVETAVKLSMNFRLLATKEKERAKDLLAAGTYCEAMATELNAIASSMNSAGMLLKSVDDRGMPILDVLIECEQKDVVSHPAVQKYLSEVWLGHLSHWAGWKMIMLFAALLFVPPIWLAFSLPLKHRFNKVPVIKFMSYLVSHIYLIALYILVVVYPLVPIWESSNLLPHWYEWLLLAWLSGLLVSQLTNPEDRAGLGWIKVIILAISCMGVSIHLLAFAFHGDTRLECIYIRNQFFGCSLMLCFVQMMDFLSFHHLFGPWAIIIRDLMKDLIRFLVILSIFMLGFTLQLAAIYRPVQPPIIINPDLGDGDGAGGSSSEDAFATFEMLFFALFGLIEPENLPPVHRNPIWTLTLIKAVFGVYLIVTLIVLINLLIAMMSDTYQRIQAQSDTEWKFGRAKLFRNMNKTSATPTPLNLLTKLFTYIKILYKHRGKVCSMNAQKFVDEEEELDVYSDDRSVDTGSSGGFLRNMARRSTQVAPEGSFLHQTKPKGPVSIEDVVNWSQVVDRYMALQGIGDQADQSSDASPFSQKFDDDKGDSNEPKEVGSNV